MTKRRTLHGHTLLELCMALGIVSLLAAASIPAFQGTVRASAVRSAAHELYAAVQQTRNSSIAENRPAMLCLVDSAGNCLSASGSRAHAWSSYLDAPEGRQALSSGSLPDGISLRGTRPQLTFWPVARAASNGTLTICDELEIAASRAIVISQSGRARLERLNDATCGA
jgi:type IV fimbrial biogenesis protein FimT